MASAGALTVIAVAGSVTGLLTAGVLVDRNGYGPTFVLLAAGPVIAAGLALAVPETSRRELEDINQRRGLIQSRTSATIRSSAPFSS